MSFSWKVTGWALVLFFSILIIPLSFANSKTMNESPHQQLKNGEFSVDVQCPEGMVLVKKSFISVACVTPPTAHLLVKRGWGIEIPSGVMLDPVVKNNKVAVVVITKGKPTNEDLSFVKQLGGEIIVNHTNAKGFGAFIPIDKLWIVENAPRVIDIELDHAATS
jgi:hypothetical protein